MLTSPEGEHYLGNQLNSFQVDENGVIGTTKDGELSLENTAGKSFKLSGEVWLGGPSQTSRYPESWPDGFVLYIREKDPLHRYEATSRTLTAKRLKVNGVLDNRIVQIATIAKPVMSEWISFSVEVSADRISFQFGDRREVISGPLDTAGGNKIDIAPGTKLKDLQLEVLDSDDSEISLPSKTIPLPPSQNANGAQPGSTSNGDPLPLSRNFLNSVVIIEGDFSAGSGFIAKMHDQFFIATNQHVFSGNTKFTVTGIDGTKYPTDGPLFGAVDCDVAILRVPAADNFIAIEDDSDADAEVNDPVFVLGNAEGGGVATQITGKLLGIGPAKVEVNAKFVHGNSGSPIIDTVTRKVIGIATYVRQVKPDVLQQAANASPLHWFGYRLDTIKQWEELDWKRFSSEGQQLAKAEALDNSFIDFAQQLHTKPASSVHSTNTQINDIFAAYFRDARSANKVGSQHDLANARVRYLTDLAALLNDDVGALAAQKLYSFHATELTSLMSMRKAIQDSLEDSITQVESTSNSPGN